MGNELAPGEAVEFEHWVKTNPKNSKKLEEIKEIWEKTKNYPDGFEPDIVKAIDKVHEIAGIKRYKRTFMSFPRIMLRIAAAVILFISLFGISRFIYLNSGGKEIAVNSVDSGIKEVVLPDNTHVWLNKNSTLQYPTKFARKNRKVYLSGEAYFEVFKNQQSPFYVKLENSSVTVLGTHFNIRAYPQENNTKVSVAEGKVMFSALEKTKQSVTLVGDESAMLDNKSLVMHKEHNNDLNYLAWKTNLLEFYNTPLIDAIKVLCTHFNVHYKVSNNIVSGVNVSGRFNNKKLSEILNALSVATNAEIILQNDTIIIK